jgi:hypothetical protein
MINKWNFENTREIKPEFYSAPCNTYTNKIPQASIIIKLLLEIWTVL